MLKRTKYSRLRNDSLTSLEDRTLSLKGELRLDSDFAQMDPGTSSHHGLSTLRDFIPRVANIRLQSPISLWGFGGRLGAAQEDPSPCTGWPASPGRPLQHTTAWSWGQFTTTSRYPSTHLRHLNRGLLSCSVFQYMGSVEVIQSMRTLDFDTRIQVTR
uniref:Uncharacterized protein n=1 Tax=Echeneis naucrates TaxID=173247 RepID=A0A665WYX5_ECHNA